MRTRVVLDGVSIDRSIEDVFAFLTDMTNSPAWGRTTSTEMLGDGVPEVGSRFVEVAPGDGGSKQTEITRLEHPTRFAYRSVYESGVEEVADVVFRTVDGGTRVTPSAEVHIPGMPQGEDQAFIREMQAAVRELLGNLKSVLEAS